MCCTYYLVMWGLDGVRTKHSFKRSLLFRSLCSPDMRSRYVKIPSLKFCMWLHALMTRSNVIFPSFPLASIRNKLRTTVYMPDFIFCGFSSSECRWLASKPNQDGTASVSQWNHSLNYDNQKLPLWTSTVEFAFHGLYMNVLWPDSKEKNLRNTANQMAPGFCCTSAGKPLIRLSCRRDAIIIPVVVLPLPIWIKSIFWFTYHD